MKELDAKDYGYFTISKDNYESEEDFWKAVTDALRVLTDNDNQVLFEYDDCGNYIVQYVKPKFGAGKFVMVNDEDELEDNAAEDSCNDVLFSIDCDKSTLKRCNCDSESSGDDEDDCCEAMNPLYAKEFEQKTETDYGASQETYETEHIGYEDTEEPNTYFEE